MKLMLFTVCLISTVLFAVCREWKMALAAALVGTALLTAYFHDEDYNPRDRKYQD